MLEGRKVGNEVGLQEHGNIGGVLEHMSSAKEDYAPKPQLSVNEEWGIRLGE